MLVHILAILDMLNTNIIVLGHYHIVNLPLITITIYLDVKLFFFRDWLSFVDAAAAIYCLLLFFGLSSGLTWLFVLYFAYKTGVWLFFFVAED